MSRRAGLLATLVATSFCARSARADEPAYVPIQSTETYLINYQVNAKTPETAVMLSFGPGFGAGHFYADNAAAGWIFGIGEALGIGLLLLSSEVGEPGDSVQDALRYSGTVMFAGFKVSELVLAPWSVERHNRNLARRLRVEPLVMSAPTAAGPGAAYGASLVASLE